MVDAFAAVQVLVLGFVPRPGLAEVIDGKPAGGRPTASTASRSSAIRA